MREILIGILNQLNSGDKVNTISVNYSNKICNVPDSVDFTTTIESLKEAIQKEIDKLPPENMEDTTIPEVFL